MKVLSKSLVLFFRGWQRLVSPLLGNHCRFYPSCSEYACQAVEERGVMKGIYLTVGRLLRCHSLCKGGMDPVPKAGVREKF